MPAELVPFNEEYPVLSGSDFDLQEVIEDTIGTDGLSLTDLDRIRIPGGGGTSWEIDTIEGPETVKELRGIILTHRSSRTFWETSLDDSSKEPGPPDCSSDDGRIGLGLFGAGSADNPAGKCKGCPMAQFGSAGNGSRAQACREQKQLFMMLPGNILPVMVSLPVSSLTPTKKFMMRLASSNTPPYAIEVGITLEGKNEGGRRWSVVEYRKIRDLEGDELALARAYAGQVKDLLNVSPFTPNDSA